MPDLKSKMTSWQQSRNLADILGAEIDKPMASTYRNPTYSGDPGFPAMAQSLSAATGQPFGQGSSYNPQQFGETQNPPQYRGIRLLLPQSGGDYKSLNQGRIPGHAGLMQQMLGELIVRGYPVFGGGGQMPGFERGFNPVGFGQR
jgi:hypothetical protein